jgi:hypothetical protein
MERAQRDGILIQHGIVAGYSEDYLMDNYGFRPGEFVLPNPANPHPNEIIEVEHDEEEKEGQGDDKEVKPPPAPPKGKASSSFSGSQFAVKRHPRDFEMEALALWGEGKAGVPLKAKEIAEAIRGAKSAAELVDKLGGVKELPDFAQGIVEVDEQAIRLGGEDNNG